MTLLGIIIVCLFSAAAGFFMGRAAQCICDYQCRLLNKEEEEEEKTEVINRVGNIWERVEKLEQFAQDTKDAAHGERIRSLTRPAEPWTK